MKFDQVVEMVKNVPYTRPTQGKILYDLVCTANAHHILELGCAHGVSTCYMAAALDELGKGSLLTMDYKAVIDFRPNIFTLLEQTGLHQYVTPLLADTSYTWGLMNLIEQQTEDGICHPKFDFCFIDGGHLWETDGFAFFLVEKLLKPGGWLLFDDVYWTYSDDIGDSDIAKAMPEEQRTVPQIERVFSLLVCQHPNFENMSIRGKWGWTQKKNVSADRETSCVAHNVVAEIYARQSIWSDVVALLNKFRYIHLVGQSRKRKARLS